MKVSFTGTCSYTPDILFLFESYLTPKWISSGSTTPHFSLKYFVHLECVFKSLKGLKVLLKTSSTALLLGFSAGTACNTCSLRFAWTSLTYSSMLSTTDNTTLLATPLPCNFAMIEAHISFASSFDILDVEGWFIKSRAMSDVSCCELCPPKSDWCGVCILSLLVPMSTLW